MSEHTKGPWAFQPHRGITGAPVFAIHGQDGVSVGHALTQEDARLMTAAPELLEALQKLCEAADDSDGACYGTLSTSFVRDIARAAISRATETKREAT